MIRLLSILLLLFSIAAADMTFTLESGGGFLEWDSVEREFEALVLKTSDDPYEDDYLNRGVLLANLPKDEETGDFPTSFLIPPSFLVKPEDCIGCGLCVNKCPVDAIEMIDGKAVIDAGACIACGLCTGECPVDAIFAPSQSSHFILLGIDDEGNCTIIEEI